MKHIKLFENFEVAEPIRFGDSLNQKELTILEKYNIPCPELIKKDDNYYYVYDHRCEKIKDVPLTYIHGVCSNHSINGYTINDDYSIDVDGDVKIGIGKIGGSLTKIPVRFKKVSGNFICRYNFLTSLEGCPKIVGGKFCCDDNKLTNLEGGPIHVGGSYHCSTNELTSLKGCPERINGDFYCHRNKISTLKGCPIEIVGNFICHDNLLTTLDICPEIIGGDFNCSRNKLTTRKYSIKTTIGGKLITR